MTIDDPDCVDVSFPGFFAALARLGGDGERRLSAAWSSRSTDPPGAGKSTAQPAPGRGALGYAYVDTGAMYRVVGVLARRARASTLDDDAGAGGAVSTRSICAFDDAGRRRQRRWSTAAT